MLPTIKEDENTYEGSFYDNKKSGTDGKGTAIESANGEQEPSQ